MIGPPRRVVLGIALGVLAGPLLAHAQPSGRPARIGLLCAVRCEGINLKTAKALGLTIPQSLLLRADEIIQ